VSLGCEENLCQQLFNRLATEISTPETAYQIVMPLQVEFDKRRDEDVLARKVLVNVRNADPCSRTNLGNG